MNNKIKVIDFSGDEVTVIKMNDDNKIYVGIRNVGKNLGLDESQVRAQRQKINIDPVLLKGARVISMPTNGGMQNTLCIELDFLPLWVAKINPNTLGSASRDKLIKYQLEAKEVLAKVFIHNEVVVPKNQVMGYNLEQLTPETQALVMLVNSIAQTQIEQKKQAEKINDIEKELVNIKEVHAIRSSDPYWRDKTNTIINNICRQRGDYKTPKDELYDLLNAAARCNINIRVNNMRKRAIASGAPVSVANKLNKLDAIAVDDRLKEIYIQVVKDFAIANGYNKDEINL